MSVRYPKWRLLTTDTKKVKSLSAQLDLPEQICSVLISRGLVDNGDFHDFLYPKLEKLPSPFLLKGLDRAVGLILKAQAERREVVIYGDYDVDGVTGTALLYNFLKKIDIQVSFYHPHRISEGYGLNRAGVEKIALRHPRALVVTVDCGISDFESVQFANENELSVIITDHHLPPPKLPEAEAIINPLQDGCSFPFKYLAGVGLVFYFIIGIRGKLRETGYWTSETQPNLKELLDLVALGSVADMVPLVDVNRILVRAGLDAINSSKTRRQGLQELLKRCSLTDKEISVDDIGYQLAPRINAAGRLKNAEIATNLLICEDLNAASELAESLNSVNDERKQMAEAQTIQALEMAQVQLKQGRRIIVLHQDDWHIGLIGIIASRVCEHTRRPAIILAGKPIAKGSARTIPSCNIYNLLNSCRECLEQFGGHEMAAGLTVNMSKIRDFMEMAEKYAGAQDVNLEEPELVVDAILPINGRGDFFYEKYKLLAPFGNKNSEPKFTLDEPSYLRNVQVIGKKRDHLRFTSKIFGETINGIGFGFGHLAERAELERGLIVFSLAENWFKGKKSWQIVLHDIDLKPC